MAATPSPSSRAGRIKVDLTLLRDPSSAQGAREAEWVRVYRHYGPRLESFFAGRLLRRADLDALLSDIWGRAFLNIHTLRSVSAMWSWLTTIGNNALRDRYRRERSNPEVLWTDAEQDRRKHALLAGWAGDAPTSELGDDARAAALATLSDEEREFLELYAVDGLSHGEIAIRLGLGSAAASRQRLRRLRLRLTGTLDDE